ncbi:hypothetical protein [Methylobacterium sp. Leaf99]|uniref:hypothetical protein n=1 Tax=Methylobacterium sp. Leaf99 TaxID=1736251 RepID=UPI0012EEB514|nr:hypothetical protein [Methylobacterium sp. Leaf99]
MALDPIQNRAFPGSYSSTELEGWKTVLFSSMINPAPITFGGPLVPGHPVDKSGDFIGPMKEIARERSASV